MGDMTEPITDENRKVRWAALIAALPKEEVIQMMQAMVQRLGPMPDDQAEAFRERLAQP